jgi:hypothetical protein
MGTFTARIAQDGKTNSTEHCVQIENMRFQRRRQFVHAVVSACYPKNKCTELYGSQTTMNVVQNGDFVHFLEKI